MRTLPLAAEPALLAEVLHSVPAGIAACDRDLRWIAWNRAMEELTGLAAREVIGEPAFRAAAALAGPDPAALLRAVLDGTAAELVPVALGGGRRVVARWSPHRGADGAVEGALLAAHEATAGDAGQTERLAELSRANPNPVLECDPEGRVVYANPATGHLLAEVGVTLDGFLPRHHHALVTSALQQGVPMRTVEVDVDDRVFSWTYHPHPRLGVVHLFAEDITARRAVEDQLRHDALHDALTGLPNRHLFMERLARAILHERRREGYRFAVLFLDLDRFKGVNDALGHAVGDELLVAVAARLGTAIRESDTVARFGGDEFAVLLDDVGEVEDAVRVAERIQQALAAPVALGGYELFTSASIGIALSATAYGRPENLLRNADMAMYRAKAGGTGRHELFDRAMHALALARLQMETDLRHAVDRSELALHYQPIVSLATGRIEAVEALLRWNHPERGWIAPGDFVPCAEETGLILPIGRTALARACREVAEWHRRSPAATGIGVSVNLSVRQFAQAGLVDQVAQALRESGLPPGLLHLEVTESVIVENVDVAASILRRLKALGARICLDDFGTGYSSLSSLHRLPIDALKVDRSFVARIGSGGGDAMVGTVVTIARSLGLAVVAEGVETPGQLAALRAAGCTQAQGFLISPPVEPEALFELVAASPSW